jgi:hypothetical protein
MIIKSPSGENREVNITITNNSGNVIIGQGAACHVNEQNPSREHRDGELVVADGTSMTSMFPSPQRQLVVCVDRNIMKWLNRFYTITNEIYPLRDNGRWDEFYTTVDERIKFAREKGHLEEEVFMTIEKSTALSYQKKNDQSMETVTQANSMIHANGHGLKMKEFLTVMSHCQLAALYRRQNKMFKANQAVFIAEQNAEFVPSCLAKAYVIYEKASNQALYLSIVSTLEPEREGFEKEAKEELKNCISVCEKMLNEVDTIYLRRHLFCFLKLALMNLNCRTATARSQSVSEDSVREAKDCITRMQNAYSGQMSEATSILLLTAQCDHGYRSGDYPNAAVFGRQALEIAERLGFHLEIKELKDRLVMLDHQQLRLANPAKLIKHQ